MPDSCRPRARIASMCSGQGSISVTSLPVRARCPPRYPPTAPAPTTAIRFPAGPAIILLRVHLRVQRNSAGIEEMRGAEVEAQFAPLADLERDVRAHARKDRLFDARDTSGKD